MRLLLLNFCVLLSTLAFAQKNKITVSFSNNFASQTSSGYTATLANSLPSNTPNYPPVFRDNSVKERFKYGFNMSIGYERTFYKNFAVFSGLVFSKSGFKTDEENLLFSSQYAPGRGYVFNATESYGAVQFNYSYYQIGIPVGVNYFMPIKKVKLVVGAGINANYLLNVEYKKVLYPTKNNKSLEGDEDKSLYKKINFSALINLGVEYNLNTNYALRVSPQAQYTFTNIASTNAGYKIYPYSVGLAMSILRNL